MRVKIRVGARGSYQFLPNDAAQSDFHNRYECPVHAQMVLVDGSSPWFLMVIALALSFIDEPLRRLCRA